MVVCRALLLSVFPNSDVADEWFASDLFFHFHSAVDTWFIWIAFDLPLLIITPLFVFLLRKRLVTHDEGRWGLLPLGLVLSWATLLAHHFLLDIHPLVAWCGLLVLCATHPRPWHEYRAPPLALASIVTLVTAGLFSHFALTTESSVVGTALMLGLFMSGRFLKHRLMPRTHWLLGLSAIIVSQGCISLVPLIRVPQDATRIDTQRAYSFCEASDRSSIFAAVTACFLHDSRYLVSEDCKQEHIAEFDSRTLKLKKRHILGTEDYYGRMEFVRCVEDTLVVGGSDMVQNGENLLDSTLVAPMDTPEALTRNLVKAGVGHRSAYDPKRDALYFSGEFQNDIIRYDRQTRAIDENAGDWYNHSMLVLFLLPIRGSLAFAPQSYHPGRDALYVGEVFGDAAYGFSLENHRRLAKYTTTGGIVELTVDPKRDRLYLANMWGLDVIDLASGDRLARKRLGTVNRHPIIDERRGLLYVPSTVSGLLFVLDLASLETLGAVATGYGPRYGLLTQDGRNLVLSTNNGTFRWNAESLASRFRSPQGHPRD